MLLRFAIVLVALTLSAGPPATAQTGDEQDAYTVSGIRVDVTAETTAAARDQAFVEGRRLAVAELIDRQGAGIAPGELSSAELDRMIQGFQVDEEQLAPGRYIASLTYVFVPSEVRSIVEQDGPDVRSQPEGPIVLLPVYRSGSVARLWDAPNPWHGAWLNHEGGDSEIPVIVPFGDVADVVDIDAERALAGDRAALSAIARRYDASGTLVAVAEPTDQGLSVRLLPYGADAAGPPARLTVPEGAQPGLYPAAVERVAERIDLSWFTAPDAPATDPQNRLAVLVPLASSADWFRMRNRLSQVMPVTDTTVVSLSAQEAVIELAYRGSEAQLRQALSRAGLTLRQGPEAMELRATGGGQSVDEGTEPGDGQETRPGDADAGDPR
jgi:hypothetical protein